MDFPERLQDWTARTVLALIVMACALTPRVGLSADGDVKFSPSLKISYVRNNNFYYQRASKATSNGLVFSPSLSMTAKTSRLNAGVSISTPYAQFDTRDDDNYFDPALSGSLEYKAGTSHLISFNGSVQRGHDAFGQNRTQGSAVPNGELDLWILGGGGVRYRLGAPSALFNFEIEGIGNKKTYTSNTAVTQFLDYGRYGGSLTTFVNISPKTAILAEGGYTSVRFDHLFGPADTREASEYYGRVGARWSATAKTSGDVRVGWTERRANATDDRTFQKINWVASLAWRPTERTTLTAVTGRESQESYLAGASVILNQSNALSWGQSWGQRWDSSVNGSHIHSEFVGIGRVDETSSVGLSLNYKAEKYLGIGLGTNYVHRYSNFPARNFNGITITSNLNLGF